jgi:hypothetical protein
MERPTTLGALRASGYRPRSVREELRENLIARLTAGTPLFEGVIGYEDRVVCILTGHQLKDPTATVAYHTTDQDKFEEVLGSRGVTRASYANRAIAVPNDVEAIIKAIQLYS